MLQAPTARPAPAPLAARPKQPPALRANALKRADIERGSFFATVPNDTTLEDILRPNFWQHHIVSLSGGPTPRPFARIEVVREDGSLDVDLRVVSTGPGMAVVRPLRVYRDDRDINLGTEFADADDVDLELPPGYKTTNIPAGDKKGWRVTMPNGDELAARIPKRRDAVRLAMDHFAKASAAPADLAT